MTLRDYFKRYGDAFEAYDADAIASHFALPALFVRDGVTVHVDSREALMESVESLLALHRAWDVEKARVAHVTELEAAPGHRIARVDWRLGRRLSRLGWTYATTYVLVPDETEDGWQIAAALTHDAPFV